MSLFQKLFGKPVTPNVSSKNSPTWNINSLRKQIESSILETGSLSWNRGKLSELYVCGKRVYAVIDGNSIGSFNTQGKTISKCYTHDEPIDTFAIDRDGKYFAFAGQDSKIVHLRSTENTGFIHQIEAGNNVTALAISKRNLYAGTASCEIEKYSWDPDQPQKSPDKKFSGNLSKLFEKTPNVTFITLSPKNDRIAFIVGGLLGVSKKGVETEFSLTLNDINRMSGRFSNDGKKIAAAGGSYSASWDIQSGLMSISKAKGSLKVFNLDDDNHSEYSGEHCWIKDVVWLTYNDKILSHLKVVSPEGNSITEAISIHDVDLFLTGDQQPEYIARIPESITLNFVKATDDGGFLMEFERNADDDKTLWSVAEFYLHADPISLRREKSEQQTEYHKANKERTPGLKESDELPGNHGNVVSEAIVQETEDTPDSEILSLISQLGRRDIIGPSTHWNRLLELGNQAIPYLIPLLDNSDINVVSDAAVMLGQAGAKEAIPKLKELSRSRCFEIHKAALTALANLEKQENSSLKLDKTNAYSQISSLWTAIIQGRENLYPSDVLHIFCMETISEIPGLIFSSKSEEARAWGMLGSLTFKSLHPEWPGGFDMTSRCSEARKCYEEALRCEPGDSWWSGWVTRFS